MAKEIQAKHTTGATLYAIIVSPTGGVWNGTTIDTTVTAGEWTSYDVAMTELSTTGLYTADWPAGLTTPGLYSVLAYVQAGGSPATTDACIAAGTMHLVESGIFGWQADAAVAAACAGVLSGAGTGTVVIKGLGGSTTRVTATTDSSGNRSAVTLSLPS